MKNNLIYQGENVNFKLDVKPNSYVFGDILKIDIKDDVATIIFNKEKFPQYNSDDFSREFVNSVEKYILKDTYKLEPIGDDEIIQNSSIEAYAKLLSKSSLINPFSTNVEVNFDMNNLIETIGAKREKLVRLKELLEDDDIKELLDIEVRVR